MKPFQIVWEIFVFGLQAAFLYGLALILCIGLIAYVIADSRSTFEPQKQVQIVYKDPIQEMVVPEDPPELVCTRIEGCETFKNAKTPEEYCPTCEWK